MTCLTPSIVVELMSALGSGRSFEEFFCSVTIPRTTWLDEPIAIGDCHLSPSMPLFERFDADHFDEFAKGLEVVAEDGLANLQIIGGDGDGHTYLVGSRTGEFFVLWHDPDEFENIAKTREEFIQWMVIERSDHLEGCPWEIFIPSSAPLRPIEATAWHRESMDQSTIYSKAKEDLDWTHDYRTSNGFELFNRQLGYGLRFKKEHRGHNSHLRLIADRSTVELDALQVFWNWTKTQGFGTEYT